MSLRIENAKISSTMLGYEDHGIFTAMIMVDGAGWSCGFGGYALDRYDKAIERRVGSRYGVDFISAVLKVVGVQKWEDLVGQYVRVKSEGLGGGILEIGHITLDQWFNPKMLAVETADAR